MVATISKLSLLESAKSKSDSSITSNNFPKSKSFEISDLNIVTSFAIKKFILLKIQDLKTNFFLKIRLPINMPEMTKEITDSIFIFKVHPHADTS